METSEDRKRKAEEERNAKTAERKVRWRGGPTPVLGLAHSPIRVGPNFFYIAFVDDLPKWGMFNRGARSSRRRINRDDPN